MAQTAGRERGRGIKTGKEAFPSAFQPGTVGKVTCNRIQVTSYLRVNDFSTLKATNISEKNSKNRKNT